MVAFVGYARIKNWIAYWCTAAVEWESCRFPARYLQQAFLWQNRACVRCGQRKLDIELALHSALCWWVWHWLTKPGKHYIIWQARQRSKRWCLGMRGCTTENYSYLTDAARECQCSGGFARAVVIILGCITLCCVKPRSSFCILKQPCPRKQSFMCTAPNTSTKEEL